MRTHSSSGNEGRTTTQPMNAGPAGVSATPAWAARETNFGILEDDRCIVAGVFQRRHLVHELVFACSPLPPPRLQTSPYHPDSGRSVCRSRSGPVRARTPPRHHDREVGIPSVLAPIGARDAVLGLGRFRGQNKCACAVVVGSLAVSIVSQQLFPTQAVPSVVHEPEVHFPRVATQSGDGPGRAASPFLPRLDGLEPNQKGLAPAAKDSPLRVGDPTHPRSCRLPLVDRVRTSPWRSSPRGEAGSLRRQVQLETASGNGRRNVAEKPLGLVSPSVSLARALVSSQILWILCPTAVSRLKNQQVQSLHVVASHATEVAARGACSCRPLSGRPACPRGTYSSRLWPPEHQHSPPQAELLRSET